MGSGDPPHPLPAARPWAVGRARRMRQPEHFQEIRPLAGHQPPKPTRAPKCIWELEQENAD